MANETMPRPGTPEFDAMLKEVVKEIMDVFERRHLSAQMGLSVCVSALASVMVNNVPREVWPGLIDSVVDTLRRTAQGQTEGISTLGLRRH